MNENIDKLKEHLLAIKSSIKPDRNELDKVVVSIGSIIDRFYSKSSPYNERIKYVTQQITFYKLRKIDSNPIYGWSMDSTVQEITAIIENIIDEINLLGIPTNDSMKIDKPINITNNISQNQVVSQFVSINFVLDILKNELTGSQYKEIQEITKTEKDPLKAKEKICEKLKSFGENVLSNILVSLITNPSIWSSLM